MAESTGQTRTSRYIGLYSAESTITHAKSSLRLFLGSALGRKLTAETLEAAGEQYFAERRDYQTDVETFFISIRHYAPKSINMILSFTKGFLGRNGVKLDEYRTTLGTASLLGSLAAVALFWFVKIRRVKLD